MSRVSEPAELLRRLCSRSAPGVSLVPHAATPNGGPPTRASSDPVEETHRATAAVAGELGQRRSGGACGIGADTPDQGRRGASETLPNGTVLRNCRTCGRLAAWGYGVSLDRAGVDRTGRWYCFEHREEVARVTPPSGRSLSARYKVAAAAGAEEPLRASAQAISMMPPSGGRQ